MTNKSKAKGTSWETLITNTLNERGFRARRRTLSGALDKGDIELLDFPVIIEAKNCKTMKLSEWVDEANIEALHDTTPFPDTMNMKVGVVWHHRPRRSTPGKGYVTMEGETFMLLLRYIEALKK